MPGKAMARKAWFAVGGVGALILTFLGLLVIGTYSASTGGNGRSTGLAQGSVPMEYADLIQRWGVLCDELSPSLLAAQLYQESGFNPRAVSTAEAQGIAQFIPGTWATQGVDGDGDGDRDVWDPADAIPSAASYDCALANDVRGVAGDAVDNMLAAYNAGPYRVLSSGGVPNLSETRNYVKTIRELEKSFSAPIAPVAFSEQAAGAIYFAQSKLGTKYLWGGDGTPEDGGRFDCSGLTKAAYASVGISLPRVANDQWYAGPHPKRDELQPGDMVFFANDLNNARSIHHVGLYVGGGYMIDAPFTGAVIRFDKIDTADYFGATRVTSAGAAALPQRS